jgi:hypothetical protein
MAENDGCFRTAAEVILVLCLLGTCNRSYRNSQELESMRQELDSLKRIELVDTNMAGGVLPETFYRPNDSTTLYLKIDGKQVANYLDSLNAL